jgi:hypothetical protein
MNRLQAFGILCCFLVTSFIRGAELAPDLFLGKWILDPQASHYAGNSCPKQMTIEMTREARGVHYQSHTVSSTGDISDVEYTAEYDRRPVMVTGTRGILLPVSLDQKDGMVVATYRNAFQVAATSQRSLSGDNNTMTITTTSQNSMGTNVTNVGVYKRVQALPSPAEELARTDPAPSK